MVSRSSSHEVGEETGLPGAGYPRESAGAAVAARPRSSFLDVYVLSVSGVRVERADVSVLDDRERQRAAKFVRDRDRHSYLAAHIALRYVLGRQLGLPPGEVTFLRQSCPNCSAPHGRPALAGTEQPVQFSLSHGGDLVLVGVAAAPVGVDVEEVPDAQVAADLSARLHPAEQREIAAAGRPEVAFARVWTRKEAYLKGIGTGLSRGLGTDYLGAAGLAPLPDGWNVLDVPVPAGYAGAVAVAGPTSDARVLDLPPAVIEGDAAAFD
ncbi:MAG TPA: 4'-phosphopantetheinyl transferase superfamily protein [Jatrophihabitans sp.]|jgi:4'-phosphopantetheinyl transferase|uniref:4'-phosphopantetheinyl transferase family protein n=1 Tax=Jatrophihabitans sp. TaxID=1932789 RepID=UPI002F04BD4E